MITIIDRRGKIYKGTLIASKNKKKRGGDMETIQIRTIGGSIHVGRIIKITDPKLKGVKRS